MSDRLASSPRSMNIVGLLLAAGLSVRMGTPKPLLLWCDSTLIEYQVAQLKAAGAAEVIAVLGHEAEAVEPFAVRAGARIVLNPDYREGRASSLRAGAGAVQTTCDAVVVLNVDQPRPSEIIVGLLEQHQARQDLITVPIYQFRRGHPVVLDGSLLQELRNVQEETQGLRAVISRHQGSVSECASDSPLVLLDINSPTDYEAAKQTYICG